MFGVQGSGFGVQGFRGSGVQGFRGSRPKVHKGTGAQKKKKKRKEERKKEEKKEKKEEKKTLRKIGAKIDRFSGEGGSDLRVAHTHMPQTLSPQKPMPGQTQNGRDGRVGRGAKTDHNWRWPLTATALPRFQFSQI